MSLKWTGNCNAISLMVLEPMSHFLSMCSGLTEHAPKMYKVWQLSSWIGVSAFELGDGETNCCELSVVLPVTNIC